MCVNSQKVQLCEHIAMYVSVYPKSVSFVCIIVIHMFHISSDRRIAFYDGSQSLPTVLVVCLLNLLSAISCNNSINYVTFLLLHRFVCICIFAAAASHLYSLINCIIPQDGGSRRSVCIVVGT